MKTDEQAIHTYTDMLERLTMNELEALKEVLWHDDPHGMLLKFVQQEIELRIYIN